MDKQPNGPNMIALFPGERQRLTYQTSHTLTQGEVEAFDVLRPFTFGMMLGGKDNGLNDWPENMHCTSAHPGSALIIRLAKIGGRCMRLTESVLNSTKLRCNTLEIMGVLQF
jgi:hypothetical protein